MTSSALRACVVAAAYFAAGWISRQAAAPPIYASGLWLPAAVALAATFSLGKSGAVGAFVGSLLVNLQHINLSSEAALPSQVLAALLISMGSTASALTAVLILRRLSASDADFLEPKTIAGGLIAAAGSCVIAAVIGPLALTLIRPTSVRSLTVDAATWLIGDAAGAVYFLPICLLLQAREGLLRKRAGVVAVGASATLSAILFIHFLTARSVGREAAEDFRSSCVPLRVSLERKLSSIASDLNGLAAYLRSSRVVDHAGFREFTRHTLAVHHEYAALEWIPKLSRPDALDREKNLWELHSRDIKIRGFDRKPIDLQKDPRRDFYPIAFAEPAERNAPVLGFDLASSPERRAFLEGAALRREIAAHALGSLFQRRDQAGILLALPVFKKNSGTGDKLDGFVTALIVVSDFFPKIWEANDVANSAISVSVGGVPLWASATKPASGVQIRDSFGTSFGGVDWTVSISPSADHPSLRVPQLLWAISIGGLVLGVLLIALLSLATGQAALTAREVMSTTTKLMAASKDLLERDRELLRSEKMGAVGQLASGIAHEFNNYLAGVKGLSELISADEKCGEQSRADAAEIVGACQRAAALVGQLKEFSRQTKPEMTTVSLNALIESNWRTLQTLTGQETLVKTLGRDLPLISGNADQLFQVLGNLIINAGQSHASSGTISIITTRVELEGAIPSPFGTVLPGSYSVLKIADQGSGIPTSMLPRIFEPFFTTKPLGKGSGLGLSVVHGIITGHGASVTVESAPGQGTTFSIYFPALPADSSVDKPRQPDQAQVLRGSGLILVADDEELVRKTLSRVLRAAGFTVAPAVDGLEALRTFQDRKGEIVLSILDLRMPGLHGDELFAQMKSIQPEAKVIFITGEADASALSRIDGFGAPLLRKPFDLDALRRAVAELLSPPGPN